MGLEGSRAKLRRAQEHFDVLQSSIDTFLQANPYPVIVEHPTKNLYAIRIAAEPEQPPFQDWGLLIGDCVHNLRCALDYIAWQLAGADPDDRETLFPIFESRAGWNSKRAIKRRSRLLARVPCAVTMMERFQPYHSQNPPLSALNGIRVLDDADKHKVLTVTLALQDSLRMVFKSVPVNQLMTPPRLNVIDQPLHYGAILATAVTPDGSPDVEMDAYFTPSIVFGQGVYFALGKRARVVDSLKSMITDATSVVNSFDAKFFSGFGRVYLQVPANWKVFSQR